MENSIAPQLTNNAAHENSLDEQRYRGAGRQAPHPFAGGIRRDAAPPRRGRRGFARRHY